jgi:hypothetical protein
MVDENNEDKILSPSVCSQSRLIGLRVEEGERKEINNGWFSICSTFLMISQIDSFPRIPPRVPREPTTTHKKGAGSGAKTCDLSLDSHVPYHIK